MLHIVLFQPEIPQNTGNIGRMCALTKSRLHLIHPLGFTITDRHLKRAGMDYAAQAVIARHADWDAFLASVGPARIVLMSSKASTPLPSFTFRPDDILLMGSESSGAPASVHERADARVYIPMAPGFRSLNISVSAGIALAEGLRQTQQFPGAKT